MLKKGTKNNAIIVIDQEGRKEGRYLVILEDLMDSVWYNYAHSNTQW